MYRTPCEIWPGTYILAAHPSAGHLEVVFTKVIWVEKVLGAGLQEASHRPLRLKHQVDIPCTDKAVMVFKRTC